MTTRRYAAGTDVPVAKSKAEIETLLVKHGATAFGQMVQGREAVVVFELHGRRVRMRLTMPDAEERDIRWSESGRMRTAVQQTNAYDQAVRQRWRALLLVIRAKLEAIDSGIETVEQAFLPYIGLPGGQTVGEWIAPHLEDAYRFGKVPPFLPGSTVLQLTEGER